MSLLSLFPKGRTPISLLTLWGLSTWAYSKNDHFELHKLPLSQNFASNGVRRILLDRRGFVWFFNLNNSFSRFDGNTVTEATQMFPEQILSYSTLRPFIDAQNGLWIGDLDKVCRIDLNTFQGHTYTFPPRKAWENKQIAAITGAGDLVYIATEDGKIFESRRRKAFRLIVDVSQTMPASAITNLAVFESALYFTVANHGLFRREPQGTVGRVPIGDWGNRTNYVWLQSDGTTLFAYGNFEGLVQVKHHQASRIAIQQIRSNWNFYPLQHSYFIRFLDNQTLVEKLEGDRLIVTDRFMTSTRHREDKSGLFLRNSLGIYRIKPVQKELFDVSQNFRDFNRQHISIRHIARRRRKLYLGTYEGLFRAEPQGQIQRLSNAIVYTTFEDQRGIVWVGTEGGGLKQLTQQDSLRPVVARNPLSNLYVTAIEALTETKLLIGTYQGLYVFDTQQKQWSKPVFRSDIFHLNDFKVRKLRRIGHRIYFCGEKGVGYIDGTDLTKIHTLPGLTPGYPIYDFVLDDTTLWLATSAHGLTGYSLSNQTVTPIRRREGLAGNTVFNVLYCKPHLICGTDSGLSVVDVNAHRIKNFTTEEGLPSNEFNQGAQWADGDTLYMGTIQGVMSFTPHELLTYRRETGSRPRLSSLIITSLSGADRKIYNLAYQPDQIVALGSSERILAFQFGTPDRMDGISMAYRLNDQTQWTPISGNNLTLAGLSKGLNQIRFRYQGETAESTVAFRVDPYFYETWWFTSLMGLLLLALTYSYLWFRIQKLREEQAIRTRISSDLHDELGGLLTGISMQADYLMYSTNTGQYRQKYLTQIADASKKATSAMSDMVWSIDSRNDDWESLLVRIREYAYTLFEAAEIQVTFTTEGRFSDQNLHPEVRQNLYLFFKEVVHNVCKHAHASRVKIDLSYQEQRFQMIIADNGIGLTESAHSSGQGMKNLRLRADRLHGTLAVRHLSPGLALHLVIDLKKLPAGVRKNWL